MAGEVAPYLDGIPVVPDAATRDAKFPLQTRVQDQRVFNKGTGNVERWSNSAWVTDLSGGTGLVVNPMSPLYGAVGDGVTNDTTAVQTAAAVAAASKATLYFPPGKTFKLDSLKLTTGLSILGYGATIKLTSATTLGLYTDNQSSVAVGSATFVNYITISGLTIDMSAVPDVATNAALCFKYSFGNAVRDVRVTGTGGANNALLGGSGLYTSHFDSCTFFNVYLKGAAGVETITTLQFTNLDCLGFVQLDYCSTITFLHAVTQGSGLFHFQMTGCTDVQWIGGDHECSNYAGSGTISATAGAATFSQSQGAVSIVNGSMVLVAGVPYLVSAYNGSTGCTLVGYPGTAGAGTSPTFAASAFSIGTILFRFVGTGNFNMYEASSTLNGFKGAYKTGTPLHGWFQSEFSNTQNTDLTVNGRYWMLFNKRLIRDANTDWWSFSGAIPRPSPGGVDFGTLPLMLSNPAGIYCGDANDASAQAMVKTLIRDASNDVNVGTPDKDVSSMVKLHATNRGVRAYMSTAGSTPADVGGFTNAGQLEVMTVGKGLSVKEGTGAKMGVATLVAGTVTVTNTNVTASSRIFLSVSTTGGTRGFLSYTLSAGTSFTITSSSGTDTSVVNWFIVEPS